MSLAKVTRNRKILMIKVTKLSYVIAKYCYFKVNNGYQYNSLPWRDDQKHYF